MRISEAARRLGPSARRLRYREDLGLLPQVRDPLPWPSGLASSGLGASGLGASGPVMFGLGASGLGASSRVAAGPVAAAGGRGAPAGRPHGPSHRQFSEA